MYNLYHSISVCDALIFLWAKENELSLYIHWIVVSEREVEKNRVCIFCVCVCIYFYFTLGTVLLDWLTVLDDTNSVYQRISCFIERFSHVLIMS